MELEKIKLMGDFSPYINRLLYVEIVYVFDLSVGDYIEAFAAQASGETQNLDLTLALSTTAIVELNGSTDYVECFHQSNAGEPFVSGTFGAYKIIE